MPRGFCRRHGDAPCLCAMGNLYRFVEPLSLYFLKIKGKTYGYELLKLLNEHSLTGSVVDPGALYRTLRRLEVNGYVVSLWEAESAGPARRMYALTEGGEDHLIEWLQALTTLSRSLDAFLSDAKKLYPGMIE